MFARSFTLFVSLVFLSNPLTLSAQETEKAPESPESDAKKEAPGNKEAVGTPKPFGEKDDEGRISLFDGKTLTGWKELEYAGHGETTVEDGELIIGFGEMLSGIKIAEKPPLTINYEIELEAKRIDGNDFFCGLTFPIKDKHCTLVVGGWGGGVVGVSSIDNMDASENETSSYHNLKDKHWYRIRLRVEDGLIQAWLGKKKLFSLLTEKRQLSMRFGEIEDSVPLGISTYQTKAAIRNFTIKPTKKAKAGSGKSGS
ncbi:MAG: family 16 glycoside hydrolase [Verrucomicrobiota bacterium]